MEQMTAFEKHRKIRPYHSEFTDIYDLAIRKASDGDVFVEIGSWMGHSAIYMDRLIRESGKAIEFYCVDGWSLETACRIQVDLLEECGGTILPCFMMNLIDAQAWNVKIIQRKSVEAARTFEDGSLKFVFIDGDHKEPSVRADLATWMPKLRDDGILSGDDYPFPPVKKAVDGVLGEKNVLAMQRGWIRRSDAD